jgi:hypothetical protein
VNNFESLLQETEESFGYLHELGFGLEKREFVFPESFRGGFEISYSNGTSNLEIDYLEEQFEVRLQSVEIFGPTVHPGFGGNMFSGPHLVECLPRIAQVVRSSFKQVHPGA